MRKLTIIGLKIIGLMTLLSLIQLLPFLATSTYINPPSLRLGIAAAAFSIALTILFAFLLLCRTDWVADRMRIPVEPVSISAGAADLLRAALIVFGIFSVVSGTVDIAQTVYYAASSPAAQQHNLYPWSRLVGMTVKILLGWIVIGRSRRIAAKAFPANSLEN